MKGYSYRSGGGEPSMSLPMWEALVTDAVGDVIEFWGFKRNHGRVWALLYVRSEPMSSKELQEDLELSKGAVSMIVRDLEQWKVVRRVRHPGSAAWHFDAELDFMQMITHVLREREGRLISRVSQDLKDAENLARQSDDVDQETLDKIRRMRSLAGLMQKAIDVFMKTSRLDVSGTKDLL